VLRLFPVKNKNSLTDQQQSRLMILSALFVITHGLILTLAPAVRYGAGSERYRYHHWLGVAVWLIVFAFLHWQTTRKTEHRDPYLLPIIALLSGIGLMTIWRLYPAFGLRQTIWLAVAGLLVWFGLQFPFFLTFIRRYKYIWLILGLILTALTILFGIHPSGEGPALWLKVFDIYFQPSEPLKLLLIAFLAGYFTDRLSTKRRAVETILPTLILVGLALAILISQKDLGTASIFLVIYVAMLFSINGDRRVVGMALVASLIAGIAGYFLIDIVRVRIDTWLNPFGDPFGTSYQVIQSMIAIAEGGMIGAGPGLGSPGLIPVSVSDFIFAAIIEETGFVGALVIVLLFVFLIYRSSRIAITSTNTFHRYLALGIAFYFGFQSILIIGGNIGFLPLTGVTLPFVSYGGSSLLVSFFALLILITISNKTEPIPGKTFSKHTRMVLVSQLMIGVLIIEILVTSLLSFWFMPSLTSRPQNLRWSINDRFVRRGNILDRDGNILITSSGSPGAIARVSNHIPLYPVIGYTNTTYGQTGIESSMYPYLRGLEGVSEWTVFWQDLIYNQPPEGLDLRLTLDLNFQQLADTLLDDSSGSIVLMNADSGEILAMASHPYFNAETLEEDWQSLITDEDAPLINRATQGVYPAGAGLFPFILASQNEMISQNPEPETLLSDSVLEGNCSQPVEGDLTWSALVSNGCVNAQAALAEMTGQETLLALYESLGLYTPPAIHLPVADIAQPVISDNLEFYRGESSVNISPLQMALAASALTNEGILPAPRIVNGYQSPEGEWITLPKLGNRSQALPSEAASWLISYLKKPDSPHWEVCTSIEFTDGNAITWFIAGTTSDWWGQPLTVVVLLEEDNPEKAAETGLAMLEHAFRLGEN